MFMYLLTVEKILPHQLGKPDPTIAAELLVLSSEGARYAAVKA
jgi:hypothetical protein